MREPVNIGSHGMTVKCNLSAAEWSDMWLRYWSALRDRPSKLRAFSRIPASNFGAFFPGDRPWSYAAHIHRLSNHFFFPTAGLHDSIKFSRQMYAGSNPRLPLWTEIEFSFRSDENKDIAIDRTIYFYNKYKYSPDKKSRIKGKILNTETCETTPWGTTKKRSC